MEMWLRALICALCLLAAGCAAKDGASEAPAPLAGDADREAAEALLARDPAGPVPAPRLPPGMRAAAPGDSPPSVPEDGKGAVPYTVDCSSPDDPELAGAFARNSLLQRLRDSPPDSLTGLEQRLAASLDEGRDILRSQGYYAGTVTGRIEEAKPAAAGDAGTPPLAVVRVVFTPGPRYLTGRSAVTVTGGGGSGAGLPRTLADVGLPPDSPAEAARVLDAVDRAREAFRNHGYPFAAIDATRHVPDHAQRRLETDVRIAPGPFIRMGDIRAKGDYAVTRRYLEALRTWKPGDVWNQDAVENFRERLRQSGLFRSIDLAPAAEADAAGRRDVLAALEKAPPRTVGAEVKYDSDFGPGVQGGWEHRNLTGRGDSLRVTMPLWAAMQELTARYRLPYFLRRDQAFIAQAGLLNQDTDAYNLRSAAAAAGVERRLGRFWTGSAQASAEGGSVRDPHEPRREYSMFGLPLGLIFDNAGDLLNAVKGVRVIGSLIPYAGVYNEPFGALRARLEGQAFLPLAGEDALVLALRGVYGSLWGASAPDVPPSARFYSGGGGSVRGYSYQSLGPRDGDDNPLGGSSLLETGAELRWRITPEWGIVAFVDGGTAYADAVPNLGRDLRWGAGLGLRYYTAVGPLRLDAAAPLNPGKDDAPLQVYISIGQSF